MIEYFYKRIIREKKYNLKLYLSMSLFDIRFKSFLEQNDFLIVDSFLKLSGDFFEKSINVDFFTRGSVIKSDGFLNLHKALENRNYHYNDQIFYKEDFCINTYHPEIRKYVNDKLILLKNTFVEEYLSENIPHQYLELMHQLFFSKEKIGYYKIMSFINEKIEEIFSYKIKDLSYINELFAVDLSVNLESFLKKPNLDILHYKKTSTTCRDDGFCYGFKTENDRKKTGFEKEIFIYNKFKKRNRYRQKMRTSHFENLKVFFSKENAERYVETLINSIENKRKIKL